MMARWPRLLFYVIALGALLLDQATKAWAIASLRPIGTMVLIPGCFSLTWEENRGVAFGMFQGHGLLIAVLMFAVALVAIFSLRGLSWSGWEPNVVGGCLVGGALGNLLDRWRHGYVVDFFDTYVGPHHWPIFNVADSLICIAVTWIVVRQLRSGPAD